MNKHLFHSGQHFGLKATSISIIKVDTVKTGTFLVQKSFFKLYWTVINFDKSPFWGGNISKIYDCVWNLGEPQLGGTLRL